ncbi:MAG: hypothetical protein PGN16_10635 [Sphingomonas phyllosphaerae]|uniref:hypothetical protein n=1 Tax=Sphingomonas phyllosphaerae TaxID=257003 RepID=UPI002FF9B065
MRASGRGKPIYQRGDFRLYRRPDRANLEIVWYDAERKRERSTSAGTSDDGAARLEVDRRYNEANGHRYCPTCGRVYEGEAAPLLDIAISDYLLRSEGKAGYKATRSRLGHVIDYLDATAQTVTVPQVTPEWIDRFRTWLAARPVAIGKTGTTRQRSLSHVEGCVLQLAAAINDTPGQVAQFKPVQARTVAASPQFRASVPELAAMFRYCLEPGGTLKEKAQRLKERATLLAYLRAAVATWARPEEIYDLGPGQWLPAAQVLNLNPPGRRQTRKYRGTIPIPPQFAPFLDGLTGPYLSAAPRSSWEKMRVAIGLPSDRGQAGAKLIRRSMATLVRKRIGEANWRQGEMMLGHVKASISDIYAIPDPANLGLALAATGEIICEIAALVPEAYDEALRH